METNDSNRNQCADKLYYAIRRFCLHGVLRAINKNNATYNWILYIKINFT